MKNKLISFAASSALLSAMLIAHSASAAEVCTQGICEATFEFSGSHVVFEVPPGVQEIEFEAFGASGGRGGLGGKLTGVLTNLPEQLIIVVGGAGSVAASAPGGYNGGGASGGNRGNEGAGGGATDIRLNSATNSRIAVAGGGGGTGGYSGAMGGSGGGLVAEAGKSGQGSGGGAGTQSNGGSAGYSNGGTSPASGSFAQGGSGGTSWNAGGGGGGGGWYGGGGGGADDDDCCSDGGGGGGGSSYARNDYVTSPVHTQGVQTGNGYLVLRYQLPLQVLGFSGTQVQSDKLTFELSMSSEITGLSDADITLSGTGCEIGEIRMLGTQAEIDVVNCNSTPVEVTLLALSLGDAFFGPQSNSVASLDIDLTAPTFEFVSSQELFSKNSVEIGFAIDGSLVNPDLTAFSISNCGGIEFGELASTIVVSDCFEGEHLLTLAANSISDSLGNMGPELDLVFGFTTDTIGPSASWSQESVTVEDAFLYSAVLSFSEVVDFNPADVVFDFSEACDSQYEEVEASVWKFFASCGYGTAIWNFDQSLATDAAGNPGPNSIASLQIENLELLVEEPLEPEVDEIVVQDPVQPEISEPEDPVQEEVWSPAPTIPDSSSDFVPADPVIEEETQIQETTPEAILEEVLEQVVNEVASEVQKESDPARTPSLTAPTAIRESKVLEETTQEPNDAQSAEPLTLEENTAPTAEPITVVAINDPEPRAETIQSQDSVMFNPLWIFAAFLALLIGLGLWRFSGK
ncbi:MAG: hypothetical protein K9G13_05230 [Aquiluna sp.]|nr:hypothetical protein [Aquiluna sp.]MCF8545922.1 hypothetical protein [Aquiluna sp.]